MSFGWKPPRQNAMEPVSASGLTRAFEAVGNLLRMTVGRGLNLNWVRGAPIISLADDYRLYDVKTTSAWTARAGEQMGRGKFKFLDATLDGLLSDSGLPEFEGFTWSGDVIPSGIRGVVAKINGSWRLISADCSGVS